MSKKDKRRPKHKPQEPQRRKKTSTPTPPSTTQQGALDRAASLQELHRLGIVTNPRHRTGAEAEAHKSDVLNQLQALMAAAQRNAANQGRRPNQIIHQIILPAVGPGYHAGFDIAGGDHHHIGGRTAAQIGQHTPQGGISILDTWEPDPPASSAETLQALRDAHERFERDNATPQPFLLLTCDTCGHVAPSTHLHNLCTHMRERIAAAMAPPVTSIGTRPNANGDVFPHPSPENILEVIGRLSGTQRREYLLTEPRPIEQRGNLEDTLRLSASTTMRWRMDAQWESALGEARNQESRRNALIDALPIRPFPPESAALYYDDQGVNILAHRPICIHEGRPYYEHDFIKEDTDTMSDFTNTIADTATAQDKLYSELVAPSMRTSYDGPPSPQEQLTIKEAIELMRPLFHAGRTDIQEALRLRPSPYERDQQTEATTHPLHELLDAATLAILYELIPDGAMDYLNSNWDSDYSNAISRTAIAQGFAISSGGALDGPVHHIRRAALTDAERAFLSASPTSPLARILNLARAQTDTPNGEYLPRISTDAYNALAAEYRWLSDVVHEMRTMITAEAMHILGTTAGFDMNSDMWRNLSTVRHLPCLYLRGDTSPMLYPAFNERALRVEYTYGNNFSSRSNEVVSLDYHRIWEAICQPLDLLYNNEVPYQDDDADASSINTTAPMTRRAQHLMANRHWYHISAAVHTLHQPVSQRRSHRRVPLTANRVPYDFSFAVPPTEPYRSANTALSAPHRP